MRYLQVAGREGEHYRAALGILDAAEVGLAEAREAEAVAERRAAVRAAAIAASIPEMVSIPAGSFRMGCLASLGCGKDEKPVREVRIAGFALAKHELTFAQWDVCTEYGPCRRLADGGGGRGDRPVINVNWTDTREYVDWLSRETDALYRLPSEAEWEYAARAGTSTKYHWGDSAGAEPCELRRLREPVGQKDHGAGRLVRAERLGPARHARQRVGVDG